MIVGEKEGVMIVQTPFQKPKNQRSREGGGDTGLKLKITCVLRLDKVMSVYVGR